MQGSIYKFAAVCLTLGIAACSSTKKFDNPASPDYLGLDQYPTVENSRAVASAGATLEAAEFLARLGTAAGKADDVEKGLEAANVIAKAGYFGGAGKITKSTQITRAMWNNLMSNKETARAIMGALSNNSDAISKTLKANYGAKYNAVAWNSLSDIAKNIFAGNATIYFKNAPQSAGPATFSKAEKDTIKEHLASLQKVVSDSFKDPEVAKVYADEGITQQAAVESLAGWEILTIKVMASIRKSGGEISVEDAFTLALSDHYANCLKAISSVPSALGMKAKTDFFLTHLIAEKAPGNASVSAECAAAMVATAIAGGYKDKYKAPLSFAEAVARYRELSSSCGMTTGVVARAVAGIGKALNMEQVCKSSIK